MKPLRVDGPPRAAPWRGRPGKCPKRGGRRKSAGAAPRRVL